MVPPSEEKWFCKTEAHMRWKQRYAGYMSQLRIDMAVEERTHLYMSTTENN